MSGGGSEPQTWKHFWIVPIRLPPPAGRWKMITSLRQVTSCSFLSSRCQMWQIICGGILVWSFVCWDWSVSSKLIYFQISSWTGTKVKGQCFIHQNTQPTFNTSNHVRTSYSLSSTTCSPSSWKSLVYVTYIIPNTCRHSWLGKSVDTWGSLLSLLQCLWLWDVFLSPEEERKEAEECN